MFNQPSVSSTEDQPLVPKSTGVASGSANAAHPVMHLKRQRPTPQQAENHGQPKVPKFLTMLEEIKEKEAEIQQLRAENLRLYARIGAERNFRFATVAGKNMEISSLTARIQELEEEEEDEEALDQRRIQQNMEMFGGYAVERAVIEKLREQNAKLEKEVAELKTRSEKLEELDQAEKVLEAKVQKLEAEKQVFNSSSLTQKEEIQKLKDLLEKANMEIQNQKTKNEACVKENGAKAKRDQCVLELRKDYEILMAKNDSMEEDMKRMENEIGVRDRKIVELEKAGDTSKEMTELRESYENLKAEQNTMEEHIKRLKNDSEVKKERKQMRESKEEDLLNQISRLKGENRMLKEDIKEVAILENVLKEKQEKIDELESSNRKLNDEKDHAQIAWTKAETTVRILTDGKKQLENDLKRATGQKST